MFCMNCGKQINEGTKFCPYCGAKQEGASGAQQPMASQPLNMVNPGYQGAPRMQSPQPKSNNNAAYILCAVFFVFVLGFFAYHQFTTSDEYIVKYGHFQNIPNVTVSDGLEKFCSNTKWSSKVMGGMHYVYFEGDGVDTHTGKDKKLKITFLVNTKERSFTVNYMTIGGKDVTMNSRGIINQIMGGKSSVNY